MSSKINDLFGGISAPTTQDDWDHLDYQASQLFTPHAPVDENELFAGRRPMIEAVVDTIFQKGQHAIVYGERGVGKTSLANVMQTHIFARSKRYKIIKRNCVKESKFKTIWTQLLDEMTFEDEGRPLSSMLGDKPTAYEVMRAIECFPANTRPIFIIDEYDRVRDRGTHIKMADTIKYLSDTSVDATVVIIGVAENVRSLFGGHPSIQRNVRQIKMPLMKESEMHLIFNTRMPQLHMHLDGGVQQLIVRLSEGLPGYAHLLGQNAIRVAISKHNTNVDDSVMPQTMRRTIMACDEKVHSIYETAVRSTKPTNLYKQVFIACALAQFNERGYFTAKSVIEPLSKILKRKVGYEAFDRHLREFCRDARGNVLIRVGSAKSYEYKFADALLRPFAIIKGATEGLVTREHLV